MYSQFTAPAATPLSLSIMFFSSRSDQGPQVVLLQALLRLQGYNLTISGHWQQKTEEAVAHFRMQMGLGTKHGPVNPVVFARLVQGKRIKMIDAIDAESGKVLPYAVKPLKAAGIKPILNERRVGHGVEDAMSRIRKRATDHKIGALRITGHGNRGTQISVALGDPVTALDHGQIDAYNAMQADWPSYISYAHLNELRPILKTITPCFAPYGFVDAHACRIGRQTELLEGLADIWGVPVSGGLDDQPAGAALQDRWGNKVMSTFVLSGPVVTAYPGSMNLEKWAKRVDQLIPNIPGMLEKGRNALAAKLKS